MSKGNRTRRRELGLLPEPVKCSARKTNGDPCGASPVRGATVCNKHGGSAPQVKRKAQERLLEGVPKMLKMLKELASNEDVPPQVRLAAIRDWLDRAGIDRKIEVEVSSTTFEQMVMGVLAEVTDEVQVAEHGDYGPNGQVVVGELVEEDFFSAEYDKDRAALPQPALPTKPYRR